MLTVIATIVALSVLILIHEFGHFFAAKMVGIAAPRFSLGLGPKVWGFRIGETEYVLSAIPLGGYVKMAGMEDDEALENLEGGVAEPVDPERTFDAKPLWARAFVISAGVIMNLAFAVVAYAALAFAYGEAVTAETRVAVDRSVPGAPAELARIPQGARIVAVDGREVETWQEVEESVAAAAGREVTLTFADAAPVTLPVPESLEERVRFSSAFGVFREPVVTRLEPGMAAARAGIEADDRIVAIGGRPVTSWAEVVAAIRESPGRELQLLVERDGARIPVPVTPTAVEERAPTGETVTVGKLGVAYPPTPTTFRPVGAVEAVGLGFRGTWETVALVGESLRQLIVGLVSPRNLGGLLSIGEASGESAALGPAAFVAFLAFLSVNLAVLNLLPIPILDGGHLLFLAIEAVRGRPLSLEARIRLSHVGLILVVGLMLWANGNDVVRLVERWLGS